MRKADLDLDVSLETGLGQRRVKLITQVFLHKAMQALVKGHELTLDGFGKLRLVKQGGAPPPHARFGVGGKSTETTGVRHRVHFSKSEPMKRALKKHLKEKSHGEVRRRRDR